MKKICFVAASPMTLRIFMINHITHLANHYQVTVVADFNADDLEGDWLPCVRLVPISIVRQINILSDLRALSALVHFFSVENFDVVHSITPKAGLLAMLAARFRRIPNRIHNLSGQVWAARRGFYRYLLKNVDRITIKNATHLLSDSASQTAFLVREGLVKAEQVEMLGRGSICGVDPTRFCERPHLRPVVRNELCVPQEALLLLFVGRLNRDKGVLDLARAFSKLVVSQKNVWLVVVGNDEDNIEDEFRRLCGDSQRYVRRIAHTAVPERYMAAADIFVLPSYRESFGLTVIEAAACSVPAVVSRIYGLTDAVEEDVTGLMYPPGDVAALLDCLRMLCSNDALRSKMGDAARTRALSEFSMTTVTIALVAYYENLLGKV